MLAEIFRGIAAEAYLSDGAAIETLLVMKPRADHEIKIRETGLLRFECLVERYIAVNVFLIPKAVHQHDRNGAVLLGENFIKRLALPELIIGRVLHELFGEAQLSQAVPARHFAG